MTETLESHTGVKVKSVRDGVPMKVGELARRTSISPRMLRYYEEQGLLAPSRGANGYRDYAEDDVAKAELVSSLIASGLPTRLINAILGTAASHAPGICTSELKALLQAELERLNARIACMALSRDAVTSHLTQLSTTDQDPSRWTPHDGSPTVAHPLTQQPPAARATAL